MSRPLLCLCPLEDVRRSGDWDNQEERQSRGQAGTDLHTPRGQQTQRPPTLTSTIGTLDLAITEEHHPGIYIFMFCMRSTRKEEHMAKHKVAEERWEVTEAVLMEVRDDGESHSETWWNTGPWQKDTTTFLPSQSVLIAIRLAWGPVQWKVC